MAGDSRGSIAFFSTYRPPVPLDIFSCPVKPFPISSELQLTDGVSYNYNCRPIPPAALKDLFKSPVKRHLKDRNLAEVDAGFIFVSERDDSLETLHIGLRFRGIDNMKVFSLADIYGPTDFGGTRLEDSGCIAGGFTEGSQTVDYSLVYVSTKEPAQKRRSPWTIVYKTNLITGKTDRLTPKGASDLSPAVSPSRKKVAVASFPEKGWTGEIEDLQTDIYMMNVAFQPPQQNVERKLLIRNGGWPSWASDNVIFFHRKVDKCWGVFRFTISTRETVRVTPEDFDAMTPAAINETEVAVAIIRQKSNFGAVRVEAQYRHIEIWTELPKIRINDNQNPRRWLDSNPPPFITLPSTPVPSPLTILDAPEWDSVQITQVINPKCDHYNPFVLDGGDRVGYHRCRSDLLKDGKDVSRKFSKLESPIKDVGVFRAAGTFPTISKDGEKLAFVDNEFKAVWVADKDGLRVVYDCGHADGIFSTVWNQNPHLDTLYVCMGPSFNAGKTLEICTIPQVSTFNLNPRQPQRRPQQLTKGGYNNAFPSSSPDGTRLVFRSTRDGGVDRHKNLYIMENTGVGEYNGGKVTRLTTGKWTDTHCQWSPNGDWIVFSSTRDKPEGAPALDNGLDPGYFVVYLVKVKDPSVVIRMMRSGDDLAGHVCHPVFSPDGRSIAVTADLAAVSADPISLPLFVHSVRPYGDIFAVDIDPKHIEKNQDIKPFYRVTHSRYECSLPVWTRFLTDDPNVQWNILIQRQRHSFTPACPFLHAGGGESWHMTGHLLIPNSLC